MEFPALINLKLMKHPMNWAVVIVMLIIAGAIGGKLLELIDIHPASDGASGKSAYGNLPAGQIPSDDAILSINPTAAGLTT